MESMFRLDGQVALVTGASRGLGQGIAEALAHAGADIAGVATSSLGATQDCVLAAGRRFAAINVDLGRQGAVAQVVTDVVQQLGRVDILVNNAGIIRREDALEFNERDWDDVIAVNLKSVFFLAQAAARQFVRQGSGGRIVNIASVLSFQGGLRVPAYAAAKHAVAGLTKSLANEWAGRGINVNAIAPGYMVTDNTAALRADERRNADILARIPAGRWGAPSDLAGAVVFLASSASAYVHGHTLVVDGGWLGR